MLVWQAVLSSCALASVPADDSNWRFFTEIHADLRSDLDPKSNQDASNTSAAAGVLYQRRLRRINVLGEVYAANDTGEVERLQIGWPMGRGQTLWLGRFFNPIGYWNVRYHHGSYLSPSIHRPAIMEYENKGGILPMHSSGVMLEGELPLAGHALQYQLAAGEGPELSDHGELKPLDILDPGATEYDRSLAARLSMRQTGAAPMETGLFVNHTIIPSRLGSVTEIDQKIFGAFFYANWSPLEMLWTFYTATNTVTDTGVTQQGSFGGGFVHLGYTINHLWRAYVTFEEIQRASDDPYLTLFPNFVIARNLAGLRLNFRKNQSLSFEMLDSKLSQGSHIHTSVQWSAMFN